MAESGVMLAQLGGIIEFAERVDLDRMTRAVELLLVAEPVLGCRFVADAHPPYWRRIDSADSELVVVARSEDPGTDASTFIAGELDASRHRQLSAAILQGPAADTLALRVSHVAVDGGAVRHLLYLLGEFYRTLGLQPDWVPQPNVRRRDLGDVARLAKLRQKLDALKPLSDDESFPLTEWGVPGLGSRGWPTYLSRSIGRHAFGPALEFARDRDANLDDLLTAAYYRTLFKTLVPPLHSSTPLQYACELREHLPADSRTVLANASVLLATCITPAGGERFEHTLARVVAANQKRTLNGAGLRTTLSIALAGKRTGGQSLSGMRREHRRLAPPPHLGYPVLCNFGVIDDAQLDFGLDAHVADACVFGPIGYPGGFILSASTFRDRLRLSAGVDLMAVDGRIAGEIVEGTAREVEGLSVV